MSWLSVGCASLSRLLVVLSAVARLSIAEPSCARDPARPVIRVSKFPISWPSWVSWTPTVSSRLDRLLRRVSITCWRSARLLVRAAVCATMFETVPDSPWKTSMIDPASWFTWSGERAEKRGWKPSNTAVRSIAGVVCETGMTPPGGRGLPPDAPGRMARKRWPEEVLEVDGGERRGGELLRVVDAERDTRRGCPAGSPRRPCPPRRRRCGPCRRAAARMRWRTRRHSRWRRGCSRRASVEITIEVTITETTVNTTTFTTVPGSPGRGWRDLMIR